MQRIPIQSAVYVVFAASYLANGAEDVTRANQTTTSNPATSVVTCNTPSCKKIASRLLDSINDAVDPCDNFYQYACGKWPQNHPIPADKPGVTEVWKLENEIAQVVTALVQSAQSSVDGSAPESPLERTLKRLFSQCMDEAQRDRLGATPLLDLLEHSLGGWPILTPNWNSSNFNAFGALLKSFLAGSEPFFAVEASDLSTNPQLHFIRVKEPATFAQSDVLKDDVLGKLYSQSYKQLLFNVTTLLLRDSKNSAIDGSLLSSKLFDIFDIEHNISLARMPAPVLLDAAYRQEFTLAELEANSPFNSSILRNLTNLLRSYVAAAGVTIAAHENANLTVDIKNLPLLSELDNLFVEFEQQGAKGMERLANYIGWHIVKTHADKLSKDYLDSVSHYNGNIYGMPTKLETLGTRCLNDVKRAIINASCSRLNASLLIKNVQAGFGQLLVGAASKWLDNSTYRGVVKKLFGFIVEVGYPRALLLNTSMLDEHYKDISVEENYVESMLTVANSLKVRNLKRLTKPARRDDPLNQEEWLSDVTIVQAHNDFRRNRLAVNAALLHPPFFDPDGPQYANYGSLGTVVGHEITHAFDGNTIGMDDQGVWRKDLWSARSQKFLAVYSILLRLQYDTCRTQFGRPRGAMTSSENIADNGGQKAAYKAYIRYLEHSTVPEGIPPRLQHYSPQQLFFLSAAVNLCENNRQEFSRLYFLVDHHSPAECRVNGVVSNVVEFATAFNCSVDAKMNPSVKRFVW